MHEKQMIQNPFGIAFMVHRSFGLNQILSLSDFQFLDANSIRERLFKRCGRQHRVCENTWKRLE
jgi:hypothetical protein